MYVKTGQLKLVFRHVLDLGPGSELGSQAAECAGDQGMFWAMHHLLYERQGQMYNADPKTPKAFAQELKLNSERFNSCLDSKKHLAKVQAQDAARRAAGIRIRPTFEVNGQRLPGALEFAAFQQVIEKALK